MSSKTITASRFKAKCLRLIGQMNRDHEPLTITKRGRPVAIVIPVATQQPVSIIGALRVSVLHYDDPFAPAAPASDWNAAG
jgi:prevent-host-death family protein